MRAGGAAKSSLAAPGAANPLLPYGKRCLNLGARVSFQRVRQGRFSRFILGSRSEVALQDGDTEINGPWVSLILAEFVESTDIKRAKAVHWGRCRCPQCRPEAAPRKTSEWDEILIAWCKVRFPGDQRGTPQNAPDRDPNTHDAPARGRRFGSSFGIPDECPESRVPHPGGPSSSL